MVSDASHRTPKASRSRFGCRTCRARKVKCDERPGECGNCTRLRLVCLGYGPSPKHQTQRASQESTRNSARKRTYRSCTACRASKTKCSGERPACRRCQNKDVTCEYSESSQPSWIERVEVPPTKNQNTIPTLNGMIDESTGTFQATRPQGTPRSPRSSHPQLLPDQALDPQLSSLEWINARRLPEIRKIKLLVEEYFNNVHPLRCFAFIHRPTFLQKLDRHSSEQHEDQALLYIICALGAQFYALSYSETVASLNPKMILMAGSNWARTAQSLILASLDTVTIDNLKAAILLIDYAIRMGNFANAFMLSGLITRMTQALQINLEYNTDLLCQNSETGLSITARESRRRLMWSCYVMDALVGSGVDQLTLVDERDMKIQLPCNERNFTQQISCITETLEPGTWLDFVPNELDSSKILPNMGIMAYFIRHIAIRKRVLRYIKHLDQAMVPWDPLSEFAALDAACREWYESLPASLQFTHDAIYIRKDSSQLGALCVLHCAHYQTICDLYRLGAPALYKLRAAFEFPPEQQGFLRHLQQVLFDAARTLASIIGEIAHHGSRMLADSWLPTIAYDSSRIMVYHLTQILDPRTEETKRLMAETVPLLQSNISCLKTMGSLSMIAYSLGSAAETMLHRSGVGSDMVAQNSIPDDPYQPLGEEQPTESTPGTPVQSAPDYVLNPLSIFRMARKSIPERHAPEKAQTTSTPGSTKPQSATDTEPQRDGLLQQDSVTDLRQDPQPGLDQASLEELQTLFMSDLGWAWQPADTAVGSGIQEAGLLPWAGGFSISQAEPWVPAFPFSQLN